MGLQCVVESQLMAAGMLMHKNPLGRDNRAQECSPHESQEDVDRCTNNSMKAKPSICSSSAMYDTIPTL